MLELAQQMVEMMKGKKEEELKLAGSPDKMVKDSGIMELIEQSKLEQMTTDDLMQFTTKISVAMQEQDVILDSLHADKRKNDLAEMMEDFNNKVTDIGTKSDALAGQQKLLVGTPIEFAWAEGDKPQYLMKHHEIVTGTRGFVSRSSQDKDDFKHLIDTYEVTDVTFASHDADNVAKCFEAQGKKLVLTSPQEFFALANKTDASEQHQLTIISINEFPLIADKLVDEFVKHNEVQGAKEALGAALSKTKEGESFQIQLGRLVQPGIEVRRAHFNPIELSDVGKHVWDAMDKSTPKDPRWKTWLTNIKNTIVKGITNVWKGIKAFFNFIGNMFKKAFGHSTKEQDPCAAMISNHTMEKAKAAVESVDAMFAKMRKRPQWKNAEKRLKIKTIKKADYPALFDLEDGKGQNLGVQFMELFDFEDQGETMVFQHDDYIKEFLPLRKVLNSYLARVDPTKEQENTASSFVQLLLGGPVTLAEYEEFSASQASTAVNTTVSKIDQYNGSVTLQSQVGELSALQ
jgi:hypothetical protein